MFSLMMITVSFHDIMERNLSLFPVICVLIVWLPIKEINLKIRDQECSGDISKNYSIRLQNVPEKGNTPVKYFTINCASFSKLRKQDFLFLHIAPVSLITNNHYWPSTHSANHQLSLWN